MGTERATSTKAICRILRIFLPLDYDYSIITNTHVNEEPKGKAAPDEVVKFQIFGISVSEIKCMITKGDPKTQVFSSAKLATAPNYASPIAIAIHHSSQVEVFVTCKVHFGQDDEQLATAEIYPSFKLNGSEEIKLRNFFAWLSASLPRVSKHIKGELQRKCKSS